MKKSKKLRVVFLWWFFSSLSLVGLISCSQRVDAANSVVSVNLNTMLALTVSDSAVSLPITPSDTGVFLSTSFTATVSSNNVTGHKLLLTNYDTDTNLVHAVTSTNTVPTLSTNTTKTSFPNNQWGVSLNDTDYLPIPASDSTAITVKETTGPINDDVSTIYAGAKVTNSVVSGAYIDVVTISLVANPVPLTFDEAYSQADKETMEVGGMAYYKMQDMTKSICDAVGNEEHTTLVDTRDEKTYTVFKSKAPDSRCWMNQNLDLDLSSSVTLMNTNTDLVSVTSWTPEAPNGNTITAGNLSSSTWGTSNNDPYSYDPGDVYFYTSGTDVDDAQYDSLAECNSAGHTTAECRHYHAGNYYNWSAVAASNDASGYNMSYMQTLNSICPKGWILPQGLINSGDCSDFDDLLVTYGIKNAGLAYTYLEGGFNNVRATPLFLARSGYISGGTHQDSSSGGYYWTSSVNSTTEAYSLGVYSTYIFSQTTNDRSAGFSVRCLANFTNHTYYLDYNPNGSNVSGLPIDQMMRSNNDSHSFTISSSEPTRDGYYFLGYATSTDGDVAYLPGAQVLVTSDTPSITLYVVWGELGFNNSGITTMQAMTSSICSSASQGTIGALRDVRDSKVYSVFKGNDGKCWMNQSLDINLSTGTILTYVNTDLNSVDTWTPERNTIAPGNFSSTTWTDDNFRPHSYDPGGLYYHSSGADTNSFKYTSLADCFGAGHSVINCRRYHAGNYYNWSAAVASNDTSSLTTQYTRAPNSICPKGWRLPRGPANASENSEFNGLLVAHGIIENSTPGNLSLPYLSNGFKNIRATPLFFASSGCFSNGGLCSDFWNTGNIGRYWTSSVNISANPYFPDDYSSYSMWFGSDDVSINYGSDRLTGISIRCVAR